MFLDAGGVLVLPHRDLVCAALARVRIKIDASAVASAHYRAVRNVDQSSGDDPPAGYVAAFCEALGVPRARLHDAVGALSHLGDRERCGEILWSEPVPHAQRTIDELRRAGITVLVVTNSDGHAAENLHDARICQTTAGPGAVVDGVIDSGLVGFAKPDPAIFRVALRHAKIEPTAAVHVGDMVSVDVLGAGCAGIIPIHLDPERRCRLSDHRHIRTLNGIWHHVAPSKNQARYS